MPGQAKLLVPAGSVFPGVRSHHLRASSGLRACPHGYSPYGLSQPPGLSWFCLAAETAFVHRLTSRQRHEVNLLQSFCNLHATRNDPFLSVCDPLANELRGLAYPPPSTDRSPRAYSFPQGSGSCPTDPFCACYVPAYPVWISAPGLPRPMICSYHVQG
jgi:hypothetical protein